jgi:hypothetical protein
MLQKKEVFEMLWRFNTWSWKMSSGICDVVYGLIVVFGSDNFMQVIGMPQWLYQLILGMVIFFAGVELTNVVDDKPVLIPNWIHGIIAAVTICIGAVVFLNFGRYAEIYSLTGPWPLYVMGTLISVSGLLIVTHYLSVFERPAVQK